ncbi:MAG TPA: metallophosphoesterase [Tepidisphaeraceae bacterium]|nr:metallophosphoesterase [Tepidisphaeraceae bacterium]
MRRLLLSLLALCIPFGCSRSSKPTSDSSPAQSPTTQSFVRPWTMRPLPANEANFLLIGDWGSDNKEQRMVAKAAAAYVRNSAIQFNAAISVGDNIYYDLPKGTLDPRFKNLFEDMYDARYLNFPFYMVLGNHDYEKDRAQVQLAYQHDHPESRWKLPARWYRLDLPEDKPLVSFLMLDSNRNRLSRADWAKQTAWMEEELAKSRSTPWMMCVSHHCMFSNGAHGDNAILQVEWGSLLHQYNVDFFIMGHDHDMQHLQVNNWPPSFVLVGGGGREQKPMRRDSRGMFSRKIFGFAHLRLTADQARVRIINAKDGQVVHDFVRYRDGRLQVLSTTPSDKADKKSAYIKLFDESDNQTPVLRTLDPDPTDEPRGRKP